MCSLVLAFTLVQAESNFRKVDAIVSTEASQIDPLDRLLARYGDASAATVRQHLRAYARSIIDDDWPAMLQGNESEKTREAFSPASRGVLALNPRRDGKLRSTQKSCGHSMPSPSPETPG